MRYFSILIILFGSGLFTTMRGSPLGIPFISEITLILIIAFTIIYLTSYVLKGKKFPRIGIVLLILAIFLILFSALLAGIYHGQPVVYGMAADRKILYLLAFFPIYYFLCNMGDESLMKLLKLIIVIGFIGALVSMMFATYSNQFGLDLSSAGGRENRIGIATGFIVFAIMFLSINLLFYQNNYLKFTTKYSKILNYTILIFLLYVLLSVIQTRQFMIAITLSLLLYTFLFTKIKTKFRLIALGTITLLILLPFIDFTIFMNLFSDDYIEASARSRTIHYILEAVENNNYIGMGALVSWFYGGFPALYHPNFFLSDVGVFGTYYRYGLIGLLITFGMLLFVLLNIMKLKKGFAKTVLYVFLFYTIITLPVGAFLEMRGFNFSMMMAILAYAIGQQKNQVNFNDQKGNI